MNPILRRSAWSALAYAVLAATVAPAADPPAAKPPAAKPPGEPRARRYTKEWTDDYHGYHYEVYHAYTKKLKDEAGTEFTVEVWHGKTTDYHENGEKAWQGVYRHGKREGDFTFWAPNGTRTGLSTWENGLMHGLYTQWDQQGQKRSEVTYRKGRPDGEDRRWDAVGKLVFTRIYRDGRQWTGRFAEYGPDPKMGWVAREYKDGKVVSEERLTGPVDPAEW